LVDLDAQVDLYRSRVAGRRMLILLDNARDIHHVRWLLPGSPGNLAVVTSRYRLTDLIATNGAHVVTLNPLPQAEAREALRRTAC